MAQWPPSTPAVTPPAHPSGSSGGSTERCAGGGAGKRLSDAGVTRALDVAPGRVLAGPARRITPSMRVLSLADAAAIDAAASES